MCYEKAFHTPHVTEARRTGGLLTTALTKSPGALLVMGEALAARNAGIALALDKDLVGVQRHQCQLHIYPEQVPAVLKQEAQRFIPGAALLAGLLPAQIGRAQSCSHRLAPFLSRPISQRALALSSAPLARLTRNRASPCTCKSSP